MLMVSFHEINDVNGLGSYVDLSLVSSNLENFTERHSLLSD